MKRFRTISISRSLARLSLVFGAVSVAWFFGGCGDAVTVAETQEAGPAPVLLTDAGGDTGLDSSLRTYCASDKCPPNLTACPTSRFPCEVNLLTDTNNCGACGVVCPAGTRAADGTERETFDCVDGRCVMSCGPHAFDCDGLPDNGCEIEPGGDDNCSACGDECTDPAKACVARNLLGSFGCGCLGSSILCVDQYGYRGCLDPARDDRNCAACGHECDPDVDGGSPYPNTYYGCDKSKCGQVKCISNTLDCDNNAQTNGCETSALSNENCGACGNACPAGQFCGLNPYFTPQCMCSGSQTFCAGGDFAGVPIGSCADLTSDPYNCGACGVACPIGTMLSKSVCSYGTCGRSCVQGRADCNGNASDDCEVNTDSDPRNCGGCGNVCDAVAGQACVAGRCVVEPCDEGEGPTAR